MMKDFRYQIRKAELTDINQLIGLCKAHAEYEKARYDKTGKSELLEKALFSNSPKLFCFIVESDHKLIGYATYMIQYSTWDAANYLYMDCLYLSEASRGMRIGEKLMHRIREEASALGCDHIQWQTPGFNIGAIKFYKRIGAVSKSKERFFWEV